MVVSITQIADELTVKPELDRQTLRELGHLLLAAAGPPAMTYQEFLEWADEDTLAEWVNGEVIMTSPASNIHQDISDFLTSVMRAYVQTRKLGVVRSAPFQMKLKNGREPDLLFIQREHLARLKPTYLDGPADLVVEIVAPERVRRDRGEKFYEYAEGGVSEYWIVDPHKARADFYVLEGDYYSRAFVGASGRYDAHTLPGFWLRVEWLWETPLPSPIRTLAEIVGMDTEVLAAFEQALRRS